MNEKTRYATMQSPIGVLTFVGDGEVITRLHMEAGRDEYPIQSWVRDQNAFTSGKEQMAAYFEGELTEFELQLLAAGSQFQKKVWDALVKIPFGQTASYGEIARNVGMPSAARAVGAANRSNPIAIVVPCHRVIASSGKLGGYAGGVDRKRKLLDHEAEVLRKTY